MSDFPGIPGYKIVSELGEGGMGTVYLGIQEKLNRRVAIKVLKPFLLKDKVTAARFDKEAKTAANLSHSNIIQIFDTGKHGDYHYIVMEYLHESLKDRMKRSPNGKLHPQIALDIIEEVVKALDYAHFRGIYHRDIKPDNIMFRQDSTPVLADFGIARVFESCDELTQSGMSMGTPHYMSPEQCDAQAVDGRSDIYSLGVVLFEMLTGHKPYEGMGMVQVAIKHVNEPIPLLPPELRLYQPLIDKMMAKKRKKRLSSGAQFIQLLDRIMMGSVDLDSREEPSRKPYTLQQAGMSSNTPTVVSMDLTQQTKAKKVKLFPKYLDLLKKKLGNFKNYLRRKKFAAVALPAIVLMILILVIIFTSGGSPKEETAASLTGKHPPAAQTSQLNREQEKKQPSPQVKLKKTKSAPELIPVEKKQENNTGQRQLVELRAGFKKLNENDAADMIKRHNFFENNLNAEGVFLGNYENAIKNGEGVLIDYSAGLIWYDGNSPGEMNFQKVEKWIMELNNKQYGGYNDWRLPTLEEAASLLRKNKNKDNLHIVSMFSGSQAKIWTGDGSNSADERWIVNFDSGSVERTKGEEVFQVRPVRSFSSGEEATAKK